MIRKIKPDDARNINTMLQKIKNFSTKEVNVAMELVNVAASDQKQTDYNVFVFTEDDQIIGYHCVGKRALTDGVYDLYWIATDPDYANRGIGKKLLLHAEQFVIDRNGRWLLIETSSKNEYEGTRSFYLRNNYSKISEINDFYAVGDMLIVFGKYFNNKKN
jgi:aminoglycoside 6'-N-acetyltransferase I